MSGFMRNVLQVWTLLLAFIPTLPALSVNSLMSDLTILHYVLDCLNITLAAGKQIPDLGLLPHFDNFTIRRVDAVESQTLLLPCTVHNLGDKVVSWIRSKDLHILTSGPFAFSSDNRFESVPSLSGDFWGLRIRGVHVSDSGQYECQVNTDPKMSFAVTLAVSGGTELDSDTNSKWLGQALIKGPNKVYVSDGSLATFTCEILPVSVAAFGLQQAHGLFMTTKPKVRWLHDNKEILLQRDHQSRITIDTTYSNHKVIGVLKLSKVSWRDSGQYTCFQLSVKPDSISLSVSDEYHEHSAEAMQQDFPISSRAHQLVSFSCMFTLFLFFVNSLSNGCFYFVII